MRPSERTFCLLFTGFLFALGIVDVLNSSLTVIRNPRRTDYSIAKDKTGNTLGPWQGNFHTIRETYGNISKVGRLIPFRHSVVETLTSDAFGFQNSDYHDGMEYDGVLIGDCFTEGSDKGLFHRHLEMKTGLHIYNYNRRRATDFLADARFKIHQPKYLIVERVERGFDTHYFSWFMNSSTTYGEFLTTWQRIKAWVKDRGDLSSRSFWVESIQWGFATFRYRVQGLLPGGSPLMVPSLGMLFIHEEVTSHGLTAEERGLNSVIDSLAVLHRLCKARNIRLVIIMVPDKYTIYGKYAVGRNVVLDRGDILSSPLFTGLREKGIEYVDLYPIFKAHSDLSGPLLYELDDTRWSEYGKQLASEAFKSQVLPVNPEADTNLEKHL